MIAALRRLASLQPAPLPDKMITFGIFREIKREAERLFMTHPPLKGARIAALASTDEERAT